jgi:hypothetical protein
MGMKLNPSVQFSGDPHSAKPQRFAFIVGGAAKCQQARLYFSNTENMSFHLNRTRYRTLPPGRKSQSKGFES